MVARARAVCRPLSAMIGRSIDRRQISGPRSPRRRLAGGLCERSSGHPIEPIGPYYWNRDALFCVRDRVRLLRLNADAATIVKPVAEDPPL